MIKLSDELHIPTMGEVLREREQKQRELAAKKKARRQWAAARVNRQNADWITRPVGSNWSLYRDLATLRARSRQMVSDAPHFTKFMIMAKSNIVGPKGIQLQVQARGLDGRSLNVDLNKRVEEAFWEWTFRENCTASTKMDWLAVKNLIVEHIYRDGECLVQHIQADNAFGYALKVWNVDYLDETYNEELPNGNRVIMSVEVDKFDRPVAYYLTTPASEINFTQRRARTRVRVPAEEMTHIFPILIDESQVRGFPVIIAALLEGKNLEGYKGGVITSARATAMTMGFFKKTSPDETQFEGEEDEEGRQAEIDIDISPVSFSEMPEGWELQQFDPKQPTQNHAEFKKTVLMDVAAGLGVPYFDLAGDMESVNFSAARVGLGEAREMWQMMQQFVASTLCREVYRRWVRSAMLSGKLKLSAREYKEIQNPKWIGRSWDYLEPVKDVTADTMALESKLTSWTEVLSKKGKDLVTHLEEIKAEKELFEQYGVEYGVAPKAAAQPAKEPDEDDKGDEGKNPPPDDEGRGYEIDEMLN
jgi:lambda family phage portal protein